jgi:hypothetical protein
LTVPFRFSVPPIEIIEGEAAGKRYNSTAEDVNVPQCIKLNLKDKSAADDDARTTAIKYLEHNEGGMIQPGGESGRGWTAVISEERGKMSATISDEGSSVSIYRTPECQQLSNATEQSMAVNVSRRRIAAAGNKASEASSKNDGDALLGRPDLFDKCCHLTLASL